MTTYQEQFAFEVKKDLDGYIKRKEQENNQAARIENQIQFREYQKNNPLNEYYTIVDMINRDERYDTSDMIVVINTLQEDLDKYLGQKIIFSTSMKAKLLTTHHRPQLPAAQWASVIDFVNKYNNDIRLLTNEIGELEEQILAWKK